jgi:CRISPR/Cas system-associated exonuclease Cas4 (RecB family)
MSDIINSVYDKIDKHFENKRFKSIGKSNRSSSIGNECNRYLYLERTPVALEKEDAPISLLKVFEEGNIQERAVVEMMMDAGFKFKKSQQELTDEELQLTGHIDGFFEVEGEDLLFDIKSSSPWVFVTISDYDSLKKSKFKWLRHYPSQMQAYMHMLNIDQSFILFKNKTSGEIKIVVCVRNKEEWLAIRDRLIIVNKALADKVEPEPCDDFDLCQECPYRKHCFGDLDMTLGKEVLNDAELEADLERLDEMKKSAKDYEELSASIKARVKEKTGFVCGRYVINGKWVDKKESVVKASRYWLSNIKKIKD